MGINASRLIDKLFLFDRGQTFTRATLLHTIDRLKATGVLPSGGRGRAVELGAEEVAKVLLALAADGTPAEAARRVGDYWAMPCVEETFGFAGAATFGEALMAALAPRDYPRRDDGRLSGIERVVVCRSWQEASIVYLPADGDEKAWTYRADDAEPGPVRVYCALEGMMIEQLALEAAADRDSGGGWGRPD